MTCCWWKGIFSRTLACVCPHLSLKQVGIKVIRDFVSEPVWILNTTCDEYIISSRSGGWRGPGLTRAKADSDGGLHRSNWTATAVPMPTASSSTMQAAVSMSTKSLWVSVQEIQHQGGGMQPRNGPPLGSLLSNDVREEQVLGQGAWRLK